MRLTKTSRYGFEGQIVTQDYEKLKEWALSEPVPQQRALDIFIKYLSKKMKRVRINEYCSSYTLKHRVEELSKEIQKYDPEYQYEYIGNEDFIIAMLQNGFDIRSAGGLSPNYYFNIKTIDSQKMWKELMVKDYLDEKRRTAIIN